VHAAFEGVTCANAFFNSLLETFPKKTRMRLTGVSSQVDQCLRLKTDYCRRTAPLSVDLASSGT
jgi:hypothetical protein